MELGERNETSPHSLPAAVAVVTQVVQSDAQKRGFHFALCMQSSALSSPVDGKIDKIHHEIMKKELLNLTGSISLSGTLS